MPRKPVEKPKDEGKTTPLEAARSRRKWSQHVLAMKIGKKQPYVSDIENLRIIPGPELAKKIVEVFEGEISLLDIFLVKDRLIPVPPQTSKAA